MIDDLLGLGINLSLLGIPLVTLLCHKQVEGLLKLVRLVWQYEAKEQTVLPICPVDNSIDGKVTMLLTN